MVDEEEDQSYFGRKVKESHEKPADSIEYLEDLYNKYKTECENYRLKYLKYPDENFNHPLSYAEILQMDKTQQVFVQKKNIIIKEEVDSQKQNQQKKEEDTSEEAKKKDQKDLNLIFAKLKNMIDEISNAHKQVSMPFYTNRDFQKSKRWKVFCLMLFCLLAMLLPLLYLEGFRQLVQVTGTFCHERVWIWVTSGFLGIFLIGYGFFWGNKHQISEDDPSVCKKNPGFLSKVYASLVHAFLLGEKYETFNDYKSNCARKDWILLFGMMIECYVFYSLIASLCDASDFMLEEWADSGLALFLVWFGCIVFGVASCFFREDEHLEAKNSEKTTFRLKMTLEPTDERLFSYDKNKHQEKYNQLFKTDQEGGVGKTEQSVKKQLSEQCDFSYSNRASVGSNQERPSSFSSMDKK